ncbi:hypothetical protein [Saccharopolyspora sp. NPDC050642]|uniref:hypothetical protein n=1 Tax=Saccharopolyspora sp. NPDC050642 TaxID=3157099 RepID=UPI0033CA53A0
MKLVVALTGASGAPLEVLGELGVETHLATRYHPGTGEYVYPQAPGIPMVPHLTPAEVRGKSVVSCLLPEQFAGRHKGITASFRHSFPEDVRAKVIENWAGYGFRAA